MRNIFICLLITLLSFGLLVNEASAKRFGGGRSFGVQRSYSSLHSSASPSMKSFGKQTNSRKWGGLLGGLLAGSLLASLFMGHGAANGLLSLLILGSLAFFVINFLRKKTQASFQTTQNFNSGIHKKPMDFSSLNLNNIFSNNNTEAFVPETFLREAKVTFIRLQAAYDQKNKPDLKSFTAPEVFAEIEMQLEERGNQPNITEVINLNAELLNVAKQADSEIASVRFTGSIKENQEPAINLDEIWHFRRFAGDQQWVVGGIQQEVVEPC